MDPLLEATAPHPAPHLHRSARARARELARAARGEAMSRRWALFERWALSQVYAYRVGLTAGYVATVYFGLSALVAGVPAFDLAAPEGWTPIWGTLLIVGGVVAAAGSLSDSKRFRRVELIGAVFLFLTLGGYAGTLLWLAYGTGDTARAAAGAGFVALGIHPLVRLAWLLSQLGRKPAPSTGPTLLPPTPPAPPSTMV